MGRRDEATDRERDRTTHTMTKRDQWNEHEPDEAVRQLHNRGEPEGEPDAAVGCCAERRGEEQTRAIP